MPGTFQLLTLKVLHLRKALSPRQTGMVDHSNSVPEHYEEGKRNRREKSRVVTAPHNKRRIMWWAELPLNLEQDPSQ